MLPHRGSQKHHSMTAPSVIFGVAFNPLTSEWSSFREDTFEILSEHTSEAEAHAACRRYEAAHWRPADA
jgi:hypothetical protein